jgi:hypothetical protein
MLFSDVPTDDQTKSAQNEQADPFDQAIKLKICGSEWAKLPFDLQKLQ